MKWPTPDLMRQRANEDGRAPELRDVYLTIADNLERQGWHEFSPQAGGAIVVTEAKWREIEADAARSIAKEPAVPGWKFYFEGKVFVHRGTLAPIIAMEPTDQTFITKQDAVAAALAAIQATGAEAGLALDLIERPLPEGASEGPA